jgi:hypothetical protein
MGIPNIATYPISPLGNEFVYAFKEKNHRFSALSLQIKEKRQPRAEVTTLLLPSPCGI